MQLKEFGAFTDGGASSSSSSADSVPAGSHNMVKVRSLRHLREMVLDASHVRYFRFLMANDMEVVLDAAECEAARAEILRQHAIPKDCSEDLLAPLQCEVSSSDA